MLKFVEQIGDAIILHDKFVSGGGAYCIRHADYQFFACDHLGEMLYFSTKAKARQFIRSCFAGIGTLEKKTPTVCA